jgi:hypothetical protein
MPTVRYQMAPGPRWLRGVSPCQAPQSARRRPAVCHHTRGHTPAKYDQRLQLSHSLVCGGGTIRSPAVSDSFCL